jgi:hypothetical protein
LLDNNNHYTHFTGFMLEEEIAASLWGSTSSATRNFGEGEGRKLIRFLFI